MTNFRSGLMGLTLAGAMAVTTGAFADGPPPRSIKDAPAAPAYNWTGFYAGLNGGYGTGRPGRVTGDVFAGPGTGLLNVVLTNVNSNNNNTHGLSTGAGGFVGGGQIGYNWQLNRDVVAGIEADIQYSDISGSSNSTGQTGGFAFNSTTTQDLSWFGTLRARVGVKLADDRLLAYVTGGLAYGATENSFAVSAVTPVVILDGAGNSLSCVAPRATCVAGRSNSTSLGWTIGGGFEWALLNNLTLKAEYLHIDLGSDSFAVRPVAPATSTGAFGITTRFDNTFDVFRAGLNVRF